MSTTVEVLLHDKVVGSLAQDEREQWVFRLSEPYRRMAERPTLGQKFEDNLAGAYRGKKGSLPPFFANLVPEPGGELRPILETHLGVADGDDITLLERLGRDLPGAVEVRAAPAIPGARLTGLTDAVEPNEPIEADGEWMRFSLAGIQLKFSVLIADDRITLPAHGRLGDWLVKFASRRYAGLCENEYSIMQWARAAGFAVPETILRPASTLVGTLGEHAEPDTFVLAVRRFDRYSQGRKLHQEDLAQVVNLLPERKYDHYSYEDLVQLVAATIGEDAGEEMIRRLTLMIASGNGDAHLKNWSLLYPDRVRAVLAPLYDQVATIAWPQQIARTLALKFGGTKLMSQIGPDTVATFAARIGWDGARVSSLVEETIDRLARAWSACERTEGWPLPPEHAEMLRQHWATTPLLQGGPLARL
jgi:serine/threonine-protein kinase HipA